MSEKTPIKAFDCSPFPSGLSKNQIAALQQFGDSFDRKKQDDDNGFVFSFSQKSRNDAAPFINKIYDIESHSEILYAGRWVGWVYTKYKNDEIKIEIHPRFGDYILFTLIEEIFSFHISEDSKSEYHKSCESLFSKLIPFIWDRKFALAYKYGLPQRDIEKIHKGPNIKGRIDIRKSIIPFFRHKEVVSLTREKQFDSSIANILLLAEKIILKQTNKFKMRFSDNTQNALDNLHSCKIPSVFVDKNVYSKIKYTSIYQSFKPIVDFSWEIIKNHNFSIKQSENQNGMGMFFDMAEIWEMYLRSILKKNFSDWSIYSPQERVYENNFYKRLIIPDIIMERGDDVLVFDAKWKKMECQYKTVERSDLDRSDFFQIHTYIQYYQSIGKNVLCGGLLYPLSIDKVDPEMEQSMHCDSLFDSEIVDARQKTKFIVDGIIMPNNESNRNKVFFEEKVIEFIDRIKCIIK